MPEINQTVKVWRGNTAKINVDLTDANGAPYDPSQPGVEVEWRLATSPNGETLVQKTLSEGGIEAVSGGGAITITLLAEDTDFAPRLYYHECRVFDSSTDDVATVMTGVFIIKPSLAMGPIEGPAAASLVLTTEAPSVS